MEKIAFFIKIASNPQDSEASRTRLVIGCSDKNDALVDFIAYNHFTFDEVFNTFLNGGEVSHIDFWLTHNNARVNVFSEDGNPANLKISFYGAIEIEKPLKTLDLRYLGVNFRDMEHFYSFKNASKVSAYYNSILLSVLPIVKSENLKVSSNDAFMSEVQIPKEVQPYLNIDHPSKFNVAVACFLNAFAGRLTQKNTNEYAKKLNPFQTFEDYQDLVRARTGERICIIDAPLTLSSKQSASLKQMIAEIKEGKPQDAWQLYDKQMDVIVYEFFRLIFMLNENNKLL